MDFDFLSSNLQIAYPFTENVSVGRYGANAAVAGLVAACEVRTTDQREEILSVTGVYIESSSFPGTIDEANVSLQWTTSGAVIDLSKDAGTAQFSLSVYGSWIVAEWYAPSELTGGEDIAVKFVLPAAVLETDSGVTYIQIDKETDDLLLQSSSLLQGPNRLRRVYWKRGDTLELVADRGEEFVVRAGFNMDISELAPVLDGGRKLTRVGINAVQGAGAGRYLLCPGSAYLYTLNAVPPNDQSDLRINPEECYWSSRELDGDIVPNLEDTGISGSAVLKPAEVSISNACTACCSCDDYIATYQYLKALWDRGKLVSDRIYATRDLYAELVEQFNEIAGACEDPIIVQFDGTTNIGMNILLCNGENLTWENIQLNVSTSYTAGNVTFNSGITYSGTSGFGRIDESAGSGSSMAYTIADCIPVNGRYIVRLRWELSEAAGGTFTATTSISGGTIEEPASLTSDYTVPAPP